MFTEIDNQARVAYTAFRSDMIDAVIQIIRDATAGTEFQGHLFLVGGLLRDRILGLPPEQDIDIVCTADALAVARRLHEAGLSQHHPVVYPRFGTAMVTVQGVLVELATARRDSYNPESRKPVTEPATLEEDVLRRDFTVNTLLQDLHTGKLLDLTGRAMADIEARLLRTPLDPVETFRDDPLRMLRCVRFSARLGFSIAPDVWEALIACAPRLDIISRERIRDEFSRTLQCRGAAEGLELLRRSGLLQQFAPELLPMAGCQQNKYHLYDVWEHTLKVLEALPDDAPLSVRLAAVFHDTGKPQTRSAGADGAVHFYGHQDASARIAREVMHRLRYPNSLIAEVTRLVALHMRIGEYSARWSDAAVRRLVRDLGENLDDLFTIFDADRSACNPAYHSLDSGVVRRRIQEALAGEDLAHVQSPLDGQEIMEIAGIGPGAEVGRLKAMLVNEVVEGRLAAGDAEGARQTLRRLLEERRDG